MIKKIIVSFCLLFSLGILAQQGTASPYSFYGIGDIKFRGTAESRAMGGLSIFPDSIHLNLQNPAGYPSLRVTTFSLAGSHEKTNLVTNSQDEKAKRSSIDYIALGIPMGKFGAVAGLSSYSSVGYKNNSVNGTETSSSNGSGGVNRAFIGFGYKFSKKFSVGFDANYNFGQIETQNQKIITTVETGSLESTTSNLSGVSFNFGAMYKTKLNKKLDAFGSFTFTPEADLKSNNHRTLALVSAVTGNVSEATDYPIDNKTIKLPTKFAFGAGIGDTKKWLVGAEITLQQFNNFSNRTDIKNGTFEDAKRYVIGGYFIPKYNSFSSYFERVTYRGGFRYENTGLVLNDKSINDMAVSLGVGLPVGGKLSNINFGVEMGKRGTKAANLVEERYLNFTLSLSLSDRWFVKRKYD